METNLPTKDVRLIKYKLTLLSNGLYSNRFVFTANNVWPVIHYLPILTFTYLDEASLIWHMIAYSLAGWRKFCLPKIALLREWKHLYIDKYVGKFLNKKQKFFPVFGEFIEVLSFISKRTYLPINDLITLEFLWEGVGTSNFRTTTGHFFQNVEMVFSVDQNIESQKDQNVKNVFWVDHYYDITTSKMAFELITTLKRI
jgi:hypothetical protein